MIREQIQRTLIEIHSGYQKIEKMELNPNKYKIKDIEDLEEEMEELEMNLSDLLIDLEDKISEELLKQLDKICNAVISGKYSLKDPEVVEIFNQLNI